MARYLLVALLLAGCAHAPSATLVFPAIPLTQSWTLGDAPDPGWTPAELERRNRVFRLLPKLLQRAPAGYDNVIDGLSVVSSGDRYVVTGTHRMTGGPKPRDYAFRATYDPGADALADLTEALLAGGRSVSPR